MTTNQKSILNLLEKEFIRINQEFEGTNSFNLVDINPLKKRTQDITRVEAENGAVKASSYALATSEVYRIIALLKEDLPMAFIEKMGKSNNHCEDNTIIIAKDECCLSGGFGNHVQIDVEAFLEERHNSDLGVKEVSFKKLIYSYGGTTCDSIEDLFSRDVVKEALRRKLHI